MNITIIREVGPNGITYKLRGEHADQLAKWLASNGAVMVSESERMLRDTFLTLNTDRSEAVTDGILPAEFVEYIEEKCRKASTPLRMEFAMSKEMASGILFAKKAGSDDTPLARVTAVKVGERTVLVQIARIEPKNPVETHYVGEIDPFTVSRPKGEFLWRCVSEEIVKVCHDMACSDERVTMEWSGDLPFE